MIRSGIFSLATAALAISAPLSFWVVSPEGASAQETATTRLPQVFVEEVVVSGTTPAITGTFTAYNDETVIQGGLRYTIKLLGPAPVVEPGQFVADTAPEYDAVLSTEELTLLPNETKTIPFTYQPPAVPEGDYRLRIQLQTSQDRWLGWGDADIHVGTPNVPFALVMPGLVVGPDSQTAEPREGINVAPSSTLTLQTFATNTAAIPLTVIPRVTIYKWGITGEKLGEENRPAVVLAGNETAKQIDIPLTAGVTPDAYHVVVTLHDATGARISSTALFRYVVKGVSAKVITARFAQLATKPGESVTLTADVVGPADRETSVDATVTIALLNGQAVVGEETKSVTLESFAQTLTSSFTLSSELTAPGLRVTITGSDGAVLDTYEIIPDVTPEQLQQLTATDTSLVPGSGRWLILGILVLIALILLGFILYYRRSSVARPPVAPLLLFILAGSLLGGYGLYAHATMNGILVHTEGSRVNSGHPEWTTLEVFINKPRHNGIRYSKTNIPVEMNVSYFACNNSLTQAKVKVLYNDVVGHTGAYPLPEPIFVGQFQNMVAEGTAGCAACHRHWNGILGRVDVGAAFPGATTTLQFFSKYELRYGGTQLLEYAVDVINVFVNLQHATPTPTPTRTPTPTPSRTPTPTPTSTPTPTPTPTSTPTPTPVVTPLAFCSPTQQTVAHNATARFTTPIQPYAFWSVAGATPTRMFGANFSTTFANTGTTTLTKTVAVAPLLFDVDGSGSFTANDWNVFNQGVTPPVRSSVWQNQTNPLDVNNDGTPSSSADNIAMLNHLSLFDQLPVYCSVQITPAPPTPTPTAGPFDPGPIGETD